MGATGVDGIPVDFVKCLGEGKKEILSLCNKIYKKGECPEEFTEMFLLPIPKKNNANVRSSGLSVLYHTLRRLS